MAKTHGILWTARIRLDQEEYFCTDTIKYDLETQVLSEAAQLIEDDLGGKATLFSLEREI